MCEKWVLLGVFVVYGREREVNLFPVMPSPGWNKSLREMKIVLPPKGIEGGRSRERSGGSKYGSSPRFMNRNGVGPCR